VDLEPPVARRVDVRLAAAVVVLVLALIALAPACGSVDTPAHPERETLERYGIAVSPPAGWHARLTRATFEAATTPVIPEGNDVSLEDVDVLVRMFEYEPEPSFLAEWQQTHPAGPPRPFTAGEFGPPEFRVEPPRFPPAPGWHAGSYGGGEVRATDFASAWASTVPYRNGPRDLPPAATLETLPPDGILIWVGLARENRFPPTDELRKTRPLLSVPLQAGHAQGGPGWEGLVGEISLYRLGGWVGEQYNADLWIFYGRREPTAEQRARAQGMLDRLDLPDWGSWELDGRGTVAG
jgi:hypothetical protein